ARAAVPARARAPLEALAASYLPPTRWAAVYALGQMKLAEARPPLLRALTDVDAEVRAIAAKGLAEVALPDDVPALRPLLRDDDGRVAAEAARALVEPAEEGPPLARPSRGWAGAGHGSRPSPGKRWGSSCRRCWPWRRRRCPRAVGESSPPSGPSCGRGTAPCPSRCATPPPGSIAGWPRRRIGSGAGWTRCFAAAAAGSSRPGGSSWGSARWRRARGCPERWCETAGFRC